MGSDKIVAAFFFAILSLVCPAFPCVCSMCSKPKTHTDSAAITGVVDFV